MNLPPPPEAPPEGADIQQLRDWIREYHDWTLLLYEFLKFPVFHLIKIIQRSDAPSEAIGGVIYYDSDDEKLKCHNDTDWQNLY